MGRTQLSQEGKWFISQSHMNSQDYNEDKAICGKALDFHAPTHSALAEGHKSEENYRKPHCMHLEKDNANAHVSPFSSTEDYSFKLVC